MEKRKKVKSIAIVIFLVSTLFFIQSVSALTANSSTYSVSMFGTGMSTATPSSANYNSTALTEAKGTTRNAESDSYRVNIGFFENTAYYRTVSITSYSTSPSSAVIGSTIGLYISALNPQSVWAVITSPNSQTQTISLINNEFVIYSPPSVVGTYTVTFYANSSTGAISSVIDYFELTAQTTAPPPGGGGGGGSTKIIEKCIYNWDCTPWSVCANGKQTRECKNIGTCNGTENKPIEVMKCSEALFDIALNLKNIELTEDKTLKFKTILTEKLGTEKIDVYVKYSIINKEGHEIFNQVETKAVQGNLSYEKEIEEIELVDGEYTLNVEIFYGYQQRAFAEQKIKISKGKIKIGESVSGIQNIIGVLNNYKLFILIIILIIIIIPISLRAFFIFRKDGHQKQGHSKYRDKIKHNLKRIGRRHFLIFVLGASLITLFFTTGNKLTGFSIRSASTIRNNWNIFGFILIIGMLGSLVFAYRKKIVEIRKINKLPKNSIKGLIKKKVYCGEGNYIGKVDEVLIEENKISSLRIKLDKKQKLKIKGILIKYKNVKSVGHVIIVKENIFRKVK